MTLQTVPQISNKRLLLGAAALLSLCLSTSYLLFLTSFNTTWMIGIHANPILPPLFWSVTNLGGDAYVVLLVLLLAERHPGIITSWVLKTWLIGALVAQLVKHWMPMPRPASVLGVEKLSLIDHPPLVSGSMPSGHALAAVSCGLILGVVLLRKGKSPWLVVGTGLVAGLVAWTRVAVGAHWPADVIAGAGLAFGVVALAFVWERRSSWNPWFSKTPGHVLVIVLHLLIAYYLTTPQSDAAVVHGVQWTLAAVSVVRAFMLAKPIQWLLKALIWGLCLGLLYVLLRHTDWALTYTKLEALPLWLLLSCAAGWTLSFVFRAIRFQSEWKPEGHVPFLQALKTTYLHNAAVLLMPMRAGEMGYPVLVRRLFNVSWQQCFRSLLWLRFQDAVVLLVMAWLLLPFVPLALRLIGLLLFMSVWFMVSLYAKKWWLRLLRSRQFFIKHLRAFLHQRSDAWGWVWSACNWTCKLSVVALMLQCLTGLHLLQTLQGALTGELSALLPVSGPAGLGTYEVGVWTGLALPWSEMKSFMASVLFTHLFFLCVSLLGAAVCLVLNGLPLFHVTSRKDSAHV
jgi:membrane-associated phospholipid phosphatase